MFFPRNKFTRNFTSTSTLVSSVCLARLKMSQWTRMSHQRWTFPSTCSSTTATISAKALVVSWGLVSLAMPWALYVLKFSVDGFFLAMLDRICLVSQVFPLWNVSLEFRFLHGTRPDTITSIHGCHKWRPLETDGPPTICGPMCRGGVVKLFDSCNGCG